MGYLEGKIHPKITLKRHMNSVSILCTQYEALPSYVAKVSYVVKPFLGKRPLKAETTGEGRGGILASTSLRGGMHRGSPEGGKEEG